MSLLRRVIGAVLRRVRLRQRRTLREVARDAGVSLAYLSEIERGRKEASSEVLAAICDALGLRLVDLLDEVRDELVRMEPVPMPLLPRPGDMSVPPVRPGGLARQWPTPLAGYRPKPVAAAHRPPSLAAAHCLPPMRAAHRPRRLVGHRSSRVLRLARCRFASSGSALGRIGFALPGSAGGWESRFPGEPLAPRHTEGGEHAAVGQWADLGGAVGGRRGGVVR